MESTEIKINNCKGCFVNDACPLIIINEKTNQCPCVKCLVKVTCQTSCEDYDRYEDGIYVDLENVTDGEGDETIMYKE